MWSSCSSRTASAAPAVPARGVAARNRSGRSRPPIRPDERGGEHDQRERNGEEEDGDEGEAGEHHHGAVLERALADPEHGLDHDREHGGLEPEEQGLQGGRAMEQRVERAQGQDDDEAGQDEQRARDHAAPGTVQQPADVDGELLRFGAGQEHAVVERVQEPRLADPALLVDQDLVHQRDLAGGTAEAEQADLQPGAGGFGEARVRLALGVSGPSQAAGLLVGQLWVSSVASRDQR